MSETAEKIFFVCQGKRSFFETDIALLKEHHEIAVFDAYPPSIKHWPKILKGVRESDVVFIWFMGRHAILPLLFSKLLKKKSVLVAGGWDVASCPEIGYGLMRPSWLRPFLKILFKLPDRIVSVSESNRKDLLDHVFDPGAKSCVIYLAIGQNASDVPVKERMVLTVGEVTRNNLKRKGLEYFVRAAAYFPDIPFVLAGRFAKDGAIDYLKSIASENVRFTGFLAQADLENLMKRAAVYTQLSYHEAFGCSLAEAMLFECVPVITDRFALPEVAGPEARKAPFGNIAAITECIRGALQDKAGGKAARQRILNCFSTEKRRQALETLLREL